MGTSGEKQQLPLGMPDNEKTMEKALTRVGLMWILWVPISSTASVRRDLGLSAQVAFYISNLLPQLMISAGKASPCLNVYSILHFVVARLSTDFV